MNVRMRSVSVCRALLAGLLGVTCVRAQESRAEAVDVPRLDGGRYFLIDARGDAPAAGHGLLVVLPGGDGSADFLPFVENGVLGAAPADFVGAMVTARKWRDDQQVVWPTARSRVPGMRFTTEELVAGVVADVGRRRKIDPARVLVLAWSSSGPAVWEIALARRTPFTGFYVAMSVFRPERAALRRAKGRRFVLDQSPEDVVTPFRFAEAAHDELTENDAVVWLRAYRGGHGWHDQPIPRIRDGLRWLCTDEAVPETESGEALARGDELLRNGGFEDGVAGWLVLDNSGTSRAAPDGDTKHVGARALHLAKTGAMPLDLVRQEVDLRGVARVQVAAMVRSRAAKNAFVKFFVHDSDGNVLNDDVDVAQLRGDRDWERVTRTYDLPEGAKTGVLMVVMVLAGEVWIDDARITATARR